MLVYLVGGVSANLKPILQRAFKRYCESGKERGFEFFNQCVQDEIKKGSPQMGGSQMGGSQMDLYLAGRPHGAIRKNEMAEKIKEEKNMNIYLADTMNGSMGGFYNAASVKEHGVSILESFFYADEFTEKMLPFFGKFLLDSGAFTFFSGKNKNVNWEEYVDRYADFINRNKVDHFFELDIDKLIGYDRVITLRHRLENKTGKQAIPVWHKFRGKEKYLRMCQEYKYVAIGGIVSKEITPDEYKFFPRLIDIAHKNGAKIHGLGFTTLAQLPLCHFDSVDSTAWTTGNRFGAVYKFNGKTMVKYGKSEGQRMKNTRELAINNFNEWVKFQKYAENHL